MTGSVRLLFRINTYTCTQNRNRQRPHILTHWQTPAVRQHKIYSQYYDGKYHRRTEHERVSKSKSKQEKKKEKEKNTHNNSVVYVSRARSRDIIRFIFCVARPTVSIWIERVTIGSIKERFFFLSVPQAQISRVVCLLLFRSSEIEKKKTHGVHTTPEIRIQIKRHTPNADRPPVNFDHHFPTRRHTRYPIVHQLWFVVVAIAELSKNKKKKIKMNNKPNSTDNPDNTPQK